MPCVELRIDAYSYRYDGPDAESCGQWLAHLLSLFPIYPHTYLQLHVRPFYRPDPENPSGYGIPDWEENTQYWASVAAKSPADAIEQFAERLAQHAKAVRTIEEGAARV